MADVRELLRAERKARRITHPHASYTSTGNLLCNLCEVHIKSENAWSSHLHTTQHTLRLSRKQDATTTRKSEVSVSKKRKADDLESSSEDERKRVKSAEYRLLPPASEEDVEKDVAGNATISHPVQAEALTSTEAVDELELLALEADLASLEQETRAATTWSATISAPAMTAEQLAAQAREEQSAQRGRRDAEIEDEKEDAARALEDEFAEMEGLEERVKRLRARREALRIGGDGLDTTAIGDGEQSAGVTAVDGTAEEKADDDAQVDDDNDDDDDDDEDGLDDWNFGAR